MHYKSADSYTSVVQTVCSTMVHHVTTACLPLLLLLLTCLAGFSAFEMEQDGFGPFSVEIYGVDVVTVGITYGFQCSAFCYPTCQYTWIRGNATSQGPELSLQLLHILPTQTLTCTVVNPATGKSITAHKTLQVTAGPSNIQISGPPMLTFGEWSNFTCSANCYPSCSFSWNVILNEVTYRTAQGNAISITPPRSTVESEILICKAEVTVSHLTASTKVHLWVPSTSTINILGEDTVVMGKTYRFVCTAICIPSCDFTWLYMGKTYQGDQINTPIMHQGDKPKFACSLQITFSNYSKIEPLTCMATNTISHTTITATKNLTVSDPISVRPTSPALPLEGKAFSLECVGSQNPAFITWLKNGSPMPASQRVHFSTDSVTMTFSPLLEEDDGVYQCVVTQGPIPIQSVGYKMQVIYGPYSVGITGVNIVTVGILYGFQCSASCYPTCQFTWTRGNVTSQGPQLNLLFEELHPIQNLTCTAVNPITGISVTVQKMLQMTAGPSNIHISGPAFLTAGVASNFTCSADCYPSCSYSWTVLANESILSTAQGNTISVTPGALPVLSEQVVCLAQDTLSQLFISKSVILPVARLSNINIIGDSAVEMGGKYTFTCSATCIPSCEFTWKYMGKTLHGDQVQIPVLDQRDTTKFTSQMQITLSDYSKTEPLTCEATNTLSNTTITTTKNLTVVDPFSVRPSSQAPPIAGEPFTLQCVGAQDPVSIIWLKNKRQIKASERVRFSPDNTTVTFSSLFQTDTGVYQCLVVEGENSAIHNNTLAELTVGMPVLSVGYMMQVNYGPYEVLIVKPGKVPVGEEMFTLPGSTTELQCLTECFPVCSIAWFYRGKLLSTNASILFTPETPPYTAALSCVASNPVSKKNRTAETTVVVPDGPKNVTISGPHSLEVGVKASFTCSAQCTPSCRITWTVYGKTMTGSDIDITVNRYVSKESISCQAENTYTGKTAMFNETLSVSDPQWCGC